MILLRFKDLSAYGKYAPRLPPTDIVSIVNSQELICLYHSKYRITNHHLMKDRVIVETVDDFSLEKGWYRLYSGRPVLEFPYEILNFKVRK